MSRHRGAGWTLLVIALCLVAAVVLPGERDLWLAGAVAVAAIYGVVEILRVARRHVPTGPSAFDRIATRPSPAAARPGDLERMERLLGWRSYSRQEFHHRVGPLLRDLTRYRLQLSGRDLERDPSSCRNRLSPELWDIVTTRDPVRQPPNDPGPETMSTPDIARLLDEIERL